MRVRIRLQSKNNPHAFTYHNRQIHFQVKIVRNKTIKCDE